MTEPTKPTPTGPDEKTYTVAEADRFFAVECYNKTWDFIDKADRTPEDDIDMINMAHASAHHWTQRPDCTPANKARSAWQLSRVYVISGNASAATVYAQRCLDICQANSIGDWDLAFAWEALARAAHVAGDKTKRAEYIAKAKAATAEVKEEGDRSLCESEIATIPTD